MKEDLKASQDSPNADKLTEELDQQEVAEKSLQQTEEELAAANEKYLRLYSEFENFRRRSAKEKLTLVETASEGILTKLLPVVDDFERGLTAMSSVDADPKATQEGIQLIYGKLQHVLQQAGVKPMEIAKGASFDTEFHEAITQMPVEEAAMKGKVIDVTEKGYMLKEKVLRFAKVVTGA